jgi:hypothetical protein
MICIQDIFFLPAASCPLPAVRGAWPANMLI